MGFFFMKANIMKTFFSFFGGALGILVAISLIIIIPIVGLVMLVAALPAIDTARKAARKHNEQQRIGNQVHDQKAIEVKKAD